MKTLVYRFVAAVHRWHRRRIAIGELMALSNAALKDIGIHRSEIRSVVAEHLNVATPTRLHTMTQSTGNNANAEYVARHVANDEHFANAA
ncbi:MAG: DUF1127 domain-containing protein [Gammaproteobacteria bacterium]